MPVVGRAMVHVHNFSDREQDEQVDTGNNGHGLSDSPGRGDPELFRRLRTVTRIMDEAFEIPVLGIRLGLDALLGLIPGAGDIASVLISGWIVVAAARLGAPPAVIGRMLLNASIDTLLGAVPLLGDLFDIAFKANRRNLVLLEEHVRDPGPTHRRSRVIVLGAVLGVFAIVGGLVALLGWTGVLIWGAAR